MQPVLPTLHITDLPLLLLSSLKMFSGAQANPESHPISIFPLYIPCPNFKEITLALPLGYIQKLPHSHHPHNLCADQSHHSLMLRLPILTSRPNIVSSSLDFSLKKTSRVNV